MERRKLWSSTGTSQIAMDALLTLIPKPNTANADIKVRILLSPPMLSFQAISLYGQASLAIVQWLPKPEMVTYPIVLNERQLLSGQTWHKGGKPLT